jgi:CubicO group peptidase (beta-lactamase class C family)
MRFAASSSLALLLGVHLVAAASAADASKLLQERTAAAEAVVAAEAQRLLDAGAASVSVSLLVADEVVSATAYGHANVYTQSPAKPDTLYNVASTIKPTTATAVLQLVERGDLHLDKPIDTYLPEYSFRDSDGHPVTVRHLLNHTSALSQNTRYIDLWSRKAPDSLAEIAARLTVKDHPGESFEYNNAAFAVAGLLVERVSGKEFEEYILTEILGPLGISGKPVHLTPSMVERIALPYRPGENRSPKPIAQKRVDVYPAGDFYLTAADLARLLCIHVNSGRCNGVTLLQPESVSQMHDRGRGDYGLGWGILPDRDGFLIGHSGGVPGYSAYVLGDPEAHVAVAALATSGDLSRLARAALLVLRGDRWVPPEKRQTAEVAPEILAEYVGKYEMQPGFVVKIGLDDGALYLEDPKGRRLDLRADSESTFFMLEIEGTLSFLREGGRVIAFDTNPGGTARRIE